MPIGDTVDVVSHAKGCIEIDGLSGERYRARDGIFKMSPGDAKATVQYGGSYRSLQGPTSRRIGYRCTACGFGSWFVNCNRCNADCVREG
jgi:hypothetical protein